MSWRDEIVGAVKEWVAVESRSGRRADWQCLGPAARIGESGSFVVDVRDTDLSADQLDKLKLAGPMRDLLDSGYNVLEAAQSGSALTIRVPDFVDLPDPHLWVFKQSPTFLIEALRDGLAGLGDAPLGSLLAERKLRGEPSAENPPNGLFLAQQDAYRACLGTGVWLVWGPPGTGKTMVLSKAIGDLIAAGSRVLLVSGTNIAVDNALAAVVRERRHRAGDVIRVGTPQLPEVAANKEVSLKLVVAAQLVQLEMKRNEIWEQLNGIRRRAARLTQLERRLRDFDHAQYTQDRSMLAGLGPDLKAQDEQLVACRAACSELAVASVRAATEQRQYAEAVEKAHGDRELWSELDDILAQTAAIDVGAATATESAASARESWLAEIRRVADRDTLPHRFHPRRGRERAADTPSRAYESYFDTAMAAVVAREAADTLRGELSGRRDALRAEIVLSREEIAILDRDSEAASSRLAVVLQRQNFASAELRDAERAACLAGEARNRVAEAERGGLPDSHDEANRLRPQVRNDGGRVGELEDAKKEADKEYTELAHDAEGRVIKNARLVVTTLAKFRTHPAVIDGDYDAVLVDEVGAATLPEVILAVSRAKSVAVMFGDFKQLGAIIPERLKNNSRPDITTWIKPDVFAHCGIVDTESARLHPSCITLDRQSRFGSVVMKLVNETSYDGVLQPGPAVLARPDGEVEIVILDTDDLGELAEPHLFGPAKGWWPAGMLLSRALVDVHLAAGEEAGVVTPYRVQAQATLESLRDVERNGVPMADVGTAHRFQGREFPVVVFDTVEGEQGRRLWIGSATRHPLPDDEWRRKWLDDGVRLFNVATTRVKTRLYIIGSRRRICESPRDSAFGQLGALIGSPGVRCVRATALLTPPTVAESEIHLGEFGAQLRESLARHVEVTDVNDELDFYGSFEQSVDQAEHSLWIWAPWVARRIDSLLPVLHRALSRGVRIVVFVRDPSDRLQQRLPELTEKLEAVVSVVIPMNVMHQKIIVVDKKVVMLGSLNALSQSWTREIMVTMHGRHFAERILVHEHAEEFSKPPDCGVCGERKIEIRRRKAGEWFWRCYRRECPAMIRKKAWTQDIVLRSR